MDILPTVIGRRHLTLFLERLKASALVRFYSAVEELKHSPKSSWHQLGAEIFYTFVRVPKPEIKVDKTERKKIEAFLLGDTGSEVFYDIQKSVLRTLEEKYYPSFLLSEQYKLLKDSLTADDFKDISLNAFSENQDEQNSSVDSDYSMDLTNHSTYARNKLEQLQERLDNKKESSTRGTKVVCRARRYFQFWKRKSIGWRAKNDRSRRIWCEPKFGVNIWANGRLAFKVLR